MYRHKCADLERGGGDPHPHGKFKLIKFKYKITKQKAGVKQDLQDCVKISLITLHWYVTNFKKYHDHYL